MKWRETEQGTIEAQLDHLGQFADKMGIHPAHSSAPLVPAVIEYIERLRENVRLVTKSRDHYVFFSKCTVVMKP